MDCWYFVELSSGRWFTYTHAMAAICTIRSRHDAFVRNLRSRVYTMRSPLTDWVIQHQQIMQVE